MTEVEAVFDHFPVMQTERFVLRQIRESDAGALFAMFSDPQVVKYYGMDRFTNPTQAEEMVGHMRRRFADRRVIRWAIALPETDAVIGTCGFADWKRHFHVAGVGYDLTRAYWRQGVMTEVLTAVLHFGFKHLDLNRVEAYVVEANIASTRLLEKLGFQKEGLLREYGYWAQTFHDLQLYGLLKRDFLENG